MAPRRARRSASSHYLVAPGAGLAKGIELAERIAGNAPMTNFAVMHVLPRIAEADPATGYLTEALISAIAQGDDEAKARLKAFLEKRAPKTVHHLTARQSQRTMAIPVEEFRSDAAAAAPLRPVRLGSPRRRGRPPAGRQHPACGRRTRSPPTRRS